MERERASPPRTRFVVEQSKLRLARGRNVSGWNACSGPNVAIRDVERSWVESVHRATVAVTVATLALAALALAAHAHAHASISLAAITLTTTALASMRS